MNNEKIKQQVNPQQIMLQENHNLLQVQNPLDLAAEEVRRISELPLDFRQTNTFLVEAEAGAIFVDLVKGRIEVKPCSISVKIEPVKP